MMRTLDDLAVTGRRVLLRADLNVPLRSEGQGVVVADDARIRAALPTLQELRERGASIVLASHLGKPDGRDPALSMRPVAERLAALAGIPVALAPGVVGEEVTAVAEALRPGEVLMLENLRFDPGEVADDPSFARALAALADVYVDDAFATAHRAHASIDALARLLPAAAGRLMQGEVTALSGVLEHPARPLVAVLGGAKVGDKLPLIERFLALADTVLVGGAMAFPFLAAEGHPVGRCMFSREDVIAARQLLDRANGARLRLPLDLVVAAMPSDAGEITPGPEVPPGWLALDIGPSTIASFTKEIASAGTVFWNGPMGAFEHEQFAVGTRSVAHAVAGSSAQTVVGGGETVQAIDQLGLAEAIDHVSTGGGATLRFLQGRSLPGLVVLEQTVAPRPELDGAWTVTRAGV